MLDTISQINDSINSVIWGPITLLAFLAVGILFGVRTGFLQITKIKLWFSETMGALFKGKDKEEKDGKGVTAFQAMSAALSGCMGTGNIVGVATALAIGGPGAIFWMWVSAILGMMTAFAENTLSVKYHIEEKDGTFSGGPMYYIEKGMRCKPLAIIFSVMCIGASFGIGNMSQANSVTNAIHNVTGIPLIVLSVILALAVGVIIIGGIKRLVKVTSVLIPMITVVYILTGLAVIIFNASNLGSVFYEIFTGAFGWSQVAGGISGSLILLAMRTGISKGVFSNEAGLGSAAIAHGASNTKYPAKQGMWGIFQVFADTIVGCSITALVILSSGAMDSGKDGVELTSQAFSTLYGDFGAIIVAVSITLLAFSTLITWSYYGERGVAYLTKGKGIMVYRIIFCAVAVLGGTVEMSLVWNISDTLNGLMAIPNLIALVVLSPIVAKETKKYLAVVKAKKK